MKKLFIILVFCGLGLISYSQLNYFLSDSNAYFSVGYYKFWFQGDTVISNKQYKKVFRQIFDTVADFNRATYYAAVREDTLNEKIYCIQTNYGIERLICDFSLNAEDTVSVYCFWASENYPGLEFIEVHSVDSIQINNQFRKRINIKNGYSIDYEESWIEGIGSTFGLFFPSAYGVVDLGAIPELLCIHINDTMIYQNSFYNNCYYYEEIPEPNGIRENTENNIKLYPNPANNILNIEHTIKSDTQIQYYIINSCGVVYKEGVLTSNIIDISLFEKGLYFIMISYDKQNYTNKFVKL